jgi:hypothetical protein
VNERLGDNARGLGDLKRAAGHYEQAALQAATLARAQPQNLKAQLRRIEAERYHASIHYWPFNASLGDHARARPVIERLNREMDALLAQHPDSTDVMEAAAGLINQLSDFQRLEGDFAATLATQRRSVAVAERLAGTAPDNPRWQRWLYLAEGRLADALLETGASEDGVLMWQRSITRREAVANKDPKNERAQRNLANGYGPLAEQFDALGRQADALAWMQREHELLTRLQAQHPQVAALKRRLDESGRDLALQLVLNGRAAAGRQLLAGLPLAADDDDAHTRMKRAVQRARVLLPALAPADAAALVAQAGAAIDEVVAQAAREPFNAWLPREAAWGAWGLGQALRGRDPALACTWLRRASDGLAALQRAGRLPAPPQRLLPGAADDALKGCA